MKSVKTMYALELAFSDDPARLEGRPAHRDRLAALRDAGKLLAADAGSRLPGARALPDRVAVGPGCARPLRGAFGVLTASLARSA